MWPDSELHVLAVIFSTYVKRFGIAKNRLIMIGGCNHKRNDGAFWNSHPMQNHITCGHSR